MKVYNYIPQSVYEIQDGTKKFGRLYLNKQLSVHLKTTDSNSKTGNVKRTLKAIDPKHFIEYKNALKIENRSVSVIGKTRFKVVEDKHVSSKCDAILKLGNSDVAVGEFEVCEEYKFTRIVGYLPVGEDCFIAVVKLNPLLPIIAIFLLLSLIAGAVFVMMPREEVIPPNRYLEENNSGITNSNHTATRYRMNTTMTIIKDTIQDLNFENVNEGKYLRIKIKKDYKNDKDYIYDSGLVPYGKKVTADTLLKSVDPGTYETIAEVYVYNENEEQTAQTNFEIKLIVK